MYVRDDNNTAVKRVPVTGAYFPRKILKAKSSRKIKIYEKQVANVMENCKRKSNYAKGNLRLSEHNAY